MGFQILVGCSWFGLKPPYKSRRKEEDKRKRRSKIMRRKGRIACVESHHTVEESYVNPLGVAPSRRRQVAGPCCFSGELEEKKKKLFSIDCSLFPPF